MDLPVALTAEILSHVPLAECLTQRALVCRTWASAAALATEHVKIKLRDDTVTAFENWLQLHAGQLLSTQLTGYGPRSSVMPRLQLPLYGFTRLRRLELERVRLCLPCDGSGSASHAAQTAPLPSLQHLQLRDVELESTRSLLQLTQAPQLMRLELSGISMAELQFDSSTLRRFGVAQGTEAAVRQVAAALPRMLAQLPRLSVLELQGLPITDAVMQEMGRLQGLQQVTLNHMQHVPGCDLQLLPSSITQLEVYDNRSDRSDSLLPQLPQLTALLHLSLHGCSVDPKVLGSVTQLHKLHLDGVWLLPEHWEASMDDDDEDPQLVDSDGRAVLLDSLSKLTCLRELELNLFNLDTIPIAPQRFSALTASSQLTSLVASYDAQPLPKAAVRHMFPAGRQAPQLRELVISQGRPKELEDWCLDTDDLAAIARACPSLQYLQLVGVVAEDADPRPLLQLPQSCTRLWVGGLFFGDNTAATVAQLTQLKDLTWTDSCEFLDVGLEQLAALYLDALCVDGCYLVGLEQLAALDRNELGVDGCGLSPSF